MALFESLTYGECKCDPTLGRARVKAESIIKSKKAFRDADLESLAEFILCTNVGRIAYDRGYRKGIKDIYWTQMRNPDGTYECGLLKRLWTRLRYRWGRYFVVANPVRRSSSVTPNG